MTFEFKPSFVRSIKQLPGAEKAAVKDVATRLMNALESHRDVCPGLGLKRLRNDIWEVRQGLKVRLLFRWATDRVEFVLAGNHDDVKRFLKE